MTNDELRDLAPRWQTDGIFTLTSLARPEMNRVADRGQTFQIQGFRQVIQKP